MRSAAFWGKCTTPAASVRGRRAAKSGRGLAGGVLMELPFFRCATTCPREDEFPLRAAGRGRSWAHLDQPEAAVMVSGVIELPRRIAAGDDAPRPAVRRS